MLAAAKVNAMRLEAFKYYYIPNGAIGLAGIVGKPTPELLKLQADIIAAVALFTVDTGTIAAFTAAHDDPAIDAQLNRIRVDVCAKEDRRTFQSARHYRVAPRDYLDKMLAEPFEPFTFSPVAWPFTSLARSARRRRNSKHWI